MFGRVLVMVAALGLVARVAEADPAANQRVVETQLAAMNRGDWRAALDVYTRDTRNFGRVVGRAVMERIFADIYTTFPDFRQHVVEIVSVGDNVIVRERMSGTHDGVGRLPVNGGMLVGVAPTTRHYEIDAIHWYKVRDGKIVDHYAVRDDLAMMQQLGLSPRPAPFDWAAFARQANAQP